MTKKSGMIVSVISASLVLLLLVGIVGFVFKYTNGFTENFKTVYVECDGKMLSASNSEETLKPKAYRFDVKSAVDIKETKPVEYSVKITPSKSIDFEFIINGETHKWHDIEDISEAFNITLEPYYFTFDLSGYADINSLFEVLYKNSNITLPKGLSERYLFTLEVTASEKIICRINFRCFEPVASIRIEDFKPILL